MTAMKNTNPDRKSFNSSLRPVAKNKIGRPKKPKPQRKPSLDDVKAKFGVTSAASLQRKPMKQRSDKNEGWWDVAIVIWGHRAHKCEICDAGLSDVPQPIFFSHLLPRGSYRRYKRDPRNLVLKCEYHHKEWHNEGPEKLQHEPEWAVICALYFTLRDEANGL